MSAPRAGLRRAGAVDLDAVNAVIERAVTVWRLPERVKRLALPSYLYRADDLNHLQLSVAEDHTHAIRGVAAWEPADPRDLPAGARALLLHGLYVDPAHQRRGLGRRLLAAALACARQQGYAGLLVKAQADASGFFSSCGMTALPVVDPERDYPHRYWQAVPATIAPAPAADPEDPAGCADGGPPPAVGQVDPETVRKGWSPPSRNPTGVPGSETFDIID